MGQLIKLSNLQPITKEEIASQAQAQTKKDYVGPDYSIDYGDKYQAGLSKKEIAKLIRQDIKAAIKAGTIPEGKYSVQMKRGNALYVTIMDVKSPWLMLNSAHVLYNHQNPGKQAFALNFYDEARPLYSKHASKLLEDLKAIVEAYNYDGSDSMTDYFNVNFYSNVTFDWEFENKQKEEIITHAG